jgi:propionate catabolism operon transcriptional regulator
MDMVIDFATLELTGNRGCGRKMRKTRILAVAPYAGMKDLITKVAERFLEAEVHVEVGDLQEGVRIAMQAEMKGFDVIVSRGGTASWIRRKVRLPVVDIGISGYDMLRVFTLVRESASQVGIIGFPNICRGARILCSLLNMQLPVFQVENEWEVIPTLQAAARQGVQIVLGDVVTVRNAQNMGYHGILITSGEEAVEEALAEAIRLSEAMAREKEKVRMLSAIVEHDPRGILLLDQERTIRYMNRAARRELAGREGEGLPLIRVMPEWDKALSYLRPQAERNEPSNRVFTAENHRLTAAGWQENGLPMTLLYIESLPDKGVNPSASGGRAGERSGDMGQAPVSFRQIIGTSGAIRRTTERAKALAKSSAHLWIFGEEGSGKTLFAQAIHYESAWGRDPWICVPCDRLSVKQDLGKVERMLSSVTRGTVFLQRLDQTPAEVLPDLFRSVQAKAGEEGDPALRVIASSEQSPQMLLQQNSLWRKLVLAWGALQLRVPPLEERMDDLDELCRVFIAHYNALYGKQIVGLREEVREMLKAWPWPANVKGLKHAMEEMVLTSEGPYIERDDALAYRETRRLQEGRTAGGEGEGFCLEGTLEEIERRILLQVLREEGMNQSRAAKRLGINRSTLWRKLKDVLHNETNRMQS